MARSAQRSAGREWNERIETSEKAPNLHPLNCPYLLVLKPDWRSGAFCLSPSGAPTHLSSCCSANVGLKSALRLLANPATVQLALRSPADKKHLL